MYVEISYVYSDTPRSLEATLSYFVSLEASTALHEETMSFDLAAIVGDPPSVSLAQLGPLRNRLYERVREIERVASSIEKLHLALSQLPPDTRLHREHVLRMLEGVIDG